MAPICLQISVMVFHGNHPITAKRHIIPITKHISEYIKYAFLFFLTLNLRIGITNIAIPTPEIAGIKNLLNLNQNKTQHHHPYWLHHIYFHNYS